MEKAHNINGDCHGCKHPRNDANQWKNRAQFRTRFISLLLFEFAEGGFFLGAGKKTLDIGSVHKDGQKADHHTQSRHNRLIPMQQQEADTEACRAQNGA